MTPLELHTAIQKGTVELKDGYYVGETDKESVYLPEAEGKELLSSYADGAKAKHAAKLAENAAEKKPAGLFSSLAGYVKQLASTEGAEAVSETPSVDGPVCSQSTYSNPAKDPSKWRSTYDNEDLLDDATVDPDDPSLTEEEREMALLKKEQTKLAIIHKKAHPATKEDEELVSALLKPDETLPAKAKEMQQEIALEIVQDIIESDDKEIGEGLKEEMAQAAHEFLESSGAKNIDTELGEEVHDSVEHYYQEHPEVAKEHGFDVEHDSGDHIGEPFQLMSDSHKTPADEESGSHDAMGPQASGDDGAVVSNYDPQQLANDSMDVAGFDPQLYNEAEDSGAKMEASGSAAAGDSVDEYGPEIGVSVDTVYPEIGSIMAESDPFFYFLSDEVNSAFVAEQSLKESLGNYQGRSGASFPNNSAAGQASENNTTVPGVSGGIALYTSAAREAASHHDGVITASEQQADRRFEEQLAHGLTAGGAAPAFGLDLFDLGAETPVDAASIVEAQAQDPLLVGLASLAGSVGLVRIGPKLAGLPTAVLAAMSKGEGQAPVLGTSQRGNPSDHGSGKERGDRDGSGGKNDGQQSHQYTETTAEYSDDDEIDQRQVA